MVLRPKGKVAACATFTSVLCAAPLAAWPLSAARAETAVAGPEQNTLEEIVVTARKRAERAQDTPISLIVATGQALESRSVTQFSELQQQTPALHMVPASISPSALNASMRGQGLNDVRLNVDPAIGVYVDGVYLPRTVGLNTAAIVDIDRVEVLAGPQGTLYGKNTTGGAVVLYTRAPTFDAFEGSVRGRYGNYGDRSLSAVLNIPVTSKLAVRLVGNLSGRDGYGHNFVNGDPAGRNDGAYFRGAVAFTPSDRLKITLRGDYARLKSVREVFKGFNFLTPLTPAANGDLIAPRATQEAALELNGLTLAAFAALPQATRNSLLQQADANLRTYGTGDPDNGFNSVAGYDDTRVWGYSATLEYELTDAISAKSITAYRAFKRQSSVDQDGTPFAITQAPLWRVSDHQVSEEFQLTGSFFSNRLKSLIGLFYSDENGREQVHNETLRVISGANPITFQIAEVGNSSFGVLTQHSFNLTDKLSLTAGIRYSKDKRNVTAHTRNSTTCTALGVALASLPNGAADCNRPMEVEFSKISYTAGAEYRLTPDIMIYAKANRGYRSGGLQQNAGGTTPALADAANQPFSPETVDDVELGLKSEFWDRRLRLNLAYYHSKLQGAQRAVSVPVGTALTVRIQNAASAKIDGVEWDLTARPGLGFELNANGAYMNARYVRYITPSGQDFTGIPLTLTPKWQYNFSVAHSFDLNADTRWRNQLDYSWTGRQLTAEPGAYSPAHGILNGRTALTFEKHQLEVAFYMKNITNKRYPTYLVDVRSSLGFIWNGAFNPPRTYGVEISKKF